MRMLKIRVVMASSEVSLKEKLTTVNDLIECATPMRRAAPGPGADTTGSGAGATKAGARLIRGLSLVWSVAKGSRHPFALAPLRGERVGVGGRLYRGAAPFPRRPDGRRPLPAEWGEAQ